MLNERNRSDLHRASIEPAIPRGISGGLGDYNPADTPARVRYAVWITPIGMMHCSGDNTSQTCRTEASWRVVCLGDTIDISDRDGRRQRSQSRVAHDASWLRGARLAYGENVTVVDISANGALLDTEQEIPLDTTIVLELIGQRRNLRVAGRVACRERFFHGGMVWYHVTMRFTRPAHLPLLSPVRGVPVA